MAERFFPNEMPLFLEESVEQAEAAKAAGERLLYRLRQPYRSVADSLLIGGMVVANVAARVTLTNRYPEFVQDYTLFTGRLGTACLLLKSYQVKNSRRDLRFADGGRELHQCLQIATMCYQQILNGSVPILGCKLSFLCGRAGVCAIGALAAKHLHDEVSMNFFLSAFHDIDIVGSIGASSELLQGRAGYLWTCLFLHKHLGHHTAPLNIMEDIAKQLILEGRDNPDRGNSPLMYEHGRYGLNYYGASRGVAGILHVLMHMNLNTEEQDYVKGTLKYIIQHRLPSGNYPETKQSNDDQLVHWGHGAPGIALTLIKAYQVFQDQEFLNAAEAAAEVVWNRGLLKRIGLCDGVSGNTYVFLSLYRATRRVHYLYKAKAFASYILVKGHPMLKNGEMYSGDHPVSLFEGTTGMAYLFLDLMNPMESRFPGYEL